MCSASTPRAWRSCAPRAPWPDLATAGAPRLRLFRRLPASTPRSGGCPLRPAPAVRCRDNLAPTTSLPVPLGGWATSCPSAEGRVMTPCFPGGFRNFGEARDAAQAGTPVGPGGPHPPSRPRDGARERRPGARLRARLRHPRLSAGARRGPDARRPSPPRRPGHAHVSAPGLRLPGVVPARGPRPGRRRLGAPRHRAGGAPPAPPPLPPHPGRTPGARSGDGRWPGARTSAPLVPPARAQPSSYAGARPGAATSPQLENTAGWRITRTRPYPGHSSIR